MARSPEYGWETLRFQSLDGKAVRGKRPLSPRGGVGPSRSRPTRATQELAAEQGRPLRVPHRLPVTAWSTCWVQDPRLKLPPGLRLGHEPGPASRGIDGEHSAATSTSCIAPSAGCATVQRQRSAGRRAGAFALHKADGRATSLWRPPPAITGMAWTGPFLCRPRRRASQASRGRARAIRKPGAARHARARRAGRGWPKTGVPQRHASSPCPWNRAGIRPGDAHPLNVTGLAQRLRSAACRRPRPGAAGRAITGQDRHRRRPRPLALRRLATRRRPGKWTCTGQHGDLLDDPPAHRRRLSCVPPGRGPRLHRRRPRHARRDRILRSATRCRPRHQAPPGLDRAAAARRLMPALRPLGQSPKPILPAASGRIALRFHPDDSATTPASVTCKARTRRPRNALFMAARWRPAQLATIADRPAKADLPAPAEKALARHTAAPCASASCASSSSARHCLCRRGHRDGAVAGHGRPGIDRRRCRPACLGAFEPPSGTPLDRQRRGRPRFQLLDLGLRWKHGMLRSLRSLRAPLAGMAVRISPLVATVPPTATPETRRSGER